MSDVDFATIRHAIASFNLAVAHTASGETRPKIEEIFAPDQHAGVLDPNVAVVLGSRGTGKSFWAGVLGNRDTRQVAAEIYPKLGLGKVRVAFGFTGLPNDGSITRSTIDARVPYGQERDFAPLMWRCVLLRALQTALNPDERSPTVSSLMEKYADPEEWEEACSAGDRRLIKNGEKILVIFDALDALASDWGRLRSLLDALLEVTWSTRGYQAIRAKLFLRPDQLRDLGLSFVELPKLIAGATRLQWNAADLYGMFFARLALTGDSKVKDAFSELLSEESVTSMPRGSRRIMKTWPLATDAKVQAHVFTRLAGAFMGRGAKKGRTYDWPINHLADGHGEVTPRSFLTLMIGAARYPFEPSNQAFSAEGIRHGLREASRVRVDQLELEFPWIKRVLAPLARLQVPSKRDAISTRWNDTGTVPAVLREARRREFLPPFDPSVGGDENQLLINALVRIGVLAVRADERFDMPDLFRVAARLLKKGGVAPA